MGLLNIKNCTVDHLLHCIVAENYGHRIYIYLEHIGRCLKIVIVGGFLCALFEQFDEREASYFQRMQS